MNEGEAFVNGGELSPTDSGTTDALALVRRQIWQELSFEMTAAHIDNPKQVLPQTT